VICVDTNCFIAYLAGEDASDVEFLDKLLRRRFVTLPPVVVAELLSAPDLPYETEVLIQSFPVLQLQEGYWQRAGKLRAKLAARGFSARLADTLIAQSCLDNGTALLTRDKGFQRFSKVAGLKLV
jgi:predicted nucleic acid-binding protein